MRINDLHLWQPWWRVDAAPTEWEPTEAEIREECAAHGWKREEPYLTKARDHLMMEREFNALSDQRDQRQ